MKYQIPAWAEPRIKINPETGCWEWQDAKRRGYGTVWKHGRMWCVHRLVYDETIGGLSSELMVLHKCDVRNCCNPEHLFLGTHTDNMRDASKKGRLRSGDRHYSRTNPERLARGERNGRNVHPEVNLRGSMNKTAKLHESQIPAIRSMVRSGMSHENVGRAFGVSKRAVWGIVHGLSWKHVPMETPTGETIEAPE